ncbi:UNVERIFIED_CONTAM: hypothetical protein K2H54_005640 [Gekko kuhli]
MNCSILISCGVTVISKLGKRKKRKKQKTKKQYFSICQKCLSTHESKAHTQYFFPYAKNVSLPMKVKTAIQESDSCQALLTLSLWQYLDCALQRATLLFLL